MWHFRFHGLPPRWFHPLSRAMAAPRGSPRATRTAYQANVWRAMQLASRSSAERRSEVQKSSQRQIEVHIRSRCMAAAHSSGARRHANVDNAVYKTGRPDHVRHPMGDRAVEKCYNSKRHNGRPKSPENLKNAGAEWRPMKAGIRHSFRFFVVCQPQKPKKAMGGVGCALKATSTRQYSIYGWPGGRCGHNPISRNRRIAAQSG